MALSVQPQEALLRELLFEALRHRNRRLNELAAEFLVRCDQSVVPYLASKARSAKQGSHYRRQLLELMGRIGVPTEDQHAYAWMMLEERLPVVRDALNEALKEECRPPRRGKKQDQPGQQSTRGHYVQQAVAPSQLGAPRGDGQATCLEATTER